MHIDFNSFYSTILISGVLDSQICVEETDAYQKLQQEVRILIAERNYVRYRMCTASDEEKIILDNLQLGIKVTISTIVYNSPWQKQIKEKGAEIMTCLEKYLLEHSCNIIAKCVDGITIEQQYSCDELNQYIQSIYGEHFKLETC